MRKLPIAGMKPAIALISALLIFSFTHAQPKHINWATDTVSKADAIGGRSTYVNTIRGSGQLATERIKLPVDKMKEILDACAAQNITEITVYFVAIRQVDIARMRKTHPEVTATGGTLKGRQMLVFKIPRRAFGYTNNSKSSVSLTNPVMVSLLGAGLMLLDKSSLDLPAGDDNYYFSIGTMCPPPAACDESD